jgi:crossover junction endodeoxyribonuclease RuvC
MARIERILVQLSGALNQWGVGPIYLENYAFRANDGRAQFAVELGGLLRWKLIDFSESAEVYEVAPATLKKFATGRGNASKEQVCAALARRYDVDFKSNDEYDAFGLFRLGLVCEGLEEAATVAQREAANTVQGVKSPKRKKGDDPNQPLLTLT